MDDNKKSKKKKNKITVDSNSNNSETNSKENKKEDSELIKKEVKSEIRDINQNEDSSNKNGMTKKRSELKIGTLSNNSNSTANNDDFPALASTKPPPGFCNKPSLPQNTVKPPPGFNSSNFPSLGISNDLTFTNSSGQSYAISPTNSQTTYKQPQNFQSRNQHLIKRFMEVLNDNDSMREFKTLSDKFRKGDVSAKEYHAQCRGIMGSKFDDIFPELLVLLPDIQKQQELFKQMSGKDKEKLVVCENCQQVIYKRELSDHYNHHRLENHFPSLGSAQHINSTWRK